MKNSELQEDIQENKLQHSYIENQSQLSSIVNTSAACSGGSSVSQNKLPQLILGYIYILKYLQSNFIG